MKLRMTFDLVKFIDDGFTAQQKYAEAAGIVGPLDPMTPAERHAKIIEHMGHLIEEVHEARAYVPRRSWKKKEASFLDSLDFADEYKAELFDILLFFRAICAYSGITGEEFAQAAYAKMNYNSKRPDHNVNAGEQEVVPHPVGELQGVCPSADYKA